METNITDNQLMDDFSKCSMSAFNEIFERYKKRLFNFIRQRYYTIDKMTAEDIVQRTLVKVYEYKYKYKPTNEFSTWVYTIIKNLSFNELKRSKMMSYNESEDDPIKPAISSLNPGNELENQNISEIVLNAIHSLKPKYSEVLILRYLQELNFKEISEILKINFDTAKSLARRGLEQLGGKLSGYNIEE